MSALSGLSQAAMNVQLTNYVKQRAENGRPSWIGVNTVRNLPLTLAEPKLSDGAIDRSPLLVGGDQCQFAYVPAHLPAAICPNLLALPLSKQ